MLERLELYFVDVLVPAAKNTLYDAVLKARKGVCMGIRGARARAHGVQPSPFGKVSYDRYSSGSLRRPQDDPRPTLAEQSRLDPLSTSMRSFSTPRAEAEGVIGQLIEIILPPWIPRGLDGSAWSVSRRSTPTTRHMVGSFSPLDGGRVLQAGFDGKVLPLPERGRPV